LRELPEDHVRLEQAETDPFNDPQHDEDDFESPANDLMTRFPPGCMVRHPSFGTGRVVRVTPSAGGSQTKAKILFTIAGPRTLILEYAKLERLNR
jgi:hypothetical protein